MAQKKQENQTEQFNIMLGLFALLQSSLHKIELLEHRTDFVREVKQKTNMYRHFLEKKLRETYVQVDLKEMDSFMELVYKLDKTSSEVNTIIKTEE